MVYTLGVRGHDDLIIRAGARTFHDPKTEVVELCCKIEGRGYNGAMRKVNKHLGFGEYVPVRRKPDGSPFPEDERD